MFKKESFFYILLAVGMFFWGESWISAKIISSYASADTLTFYRFLFTAITFFPVVGIMKEKYLVSPASLILPLFGGILLIVYNRFFFTGLLYGYAGAGGVIVTTLVPVITFLASVPLFKRKVLPKDIVGLVFGVIGASVLLNLWGGNLYKLGESGNLYFIAAAFCWSVITILSAYSKKSMTAMTYSFYLFVFATVIDYVFILKGETVFTKTPDMIFWINVWIIAIFATTYGTAIYFLATQKLGSEKASSFIFMVPATALFLSWLILDEKITLLTIIGSSFSLIAVYLINSKKPLVKMLINRLRTL